MNYVLIPPTKSIIVSHHLACQRAGFNTFVSRVTREQTRLDYYRPHQYTSSNNVRQTSLQRLCTRIQLRSLEAPNISRIQSQGQARASNPTGAEEGWLLRSPKRLSDVLCSRGILYFNVGNIRHQNGLAGRIEICFLTV